MTINKRCVCSKCLECTFQEIGKKLQQRIDKAIKILSDGACREREAKAISVLSGEL